MRIRLIQICLVLLIQSSFSQNSSIHLTGIVIDQQSGLPIPYVNITINERSGTASLEDGTFQLNIDSVGIQSKLKVSCIGYETVFVPIRTIFKYPIKILLEPATVQLAEVLIDEKSIDPKEILKKAVELMTQNTYSGIYQLEFYSKIVAIDSIRDYNYSLETVFQDIYIEPYHKFNYLQRREVGTSPLKDTKCYLASHFDLVSMDLLRDPYKTGVFSLNNIHEFEFKYEGLELYEKDTVYSISYVAPKPSKKMIGISHLPKTYYYRGKIYVTIDSYAVVRHSLSQGLPRQPLHQEVIYRKIKGYYFPYFITASKVYILKNGFHPKIKNTLILRNTELEKKDVGHPNNDNCVKLNANPAFWDSNYPTKQTKK